MIADAIEGHLGVIKEEEVNKIKRAS